MIRLAQFGKEDFQQLIHWIHNEELLQNWSGGLFRFPLSKESLDWYIEDTNTINESDAFVYKAIDESGETVGHISLGGISWKNRSARVNRVFISEEAGRGRGYCQQMMKAVLEVAFEELNMHRVYLGVYDTNAPALKCYEKSGFKTEGVQRDILWNNNTWWSMIEMSILEDEWRSLNKL